MKKGKRVLIVVPAFNEASVICEVIKSTLELFKNSPYKTDLLVLDDASTDNTKTESIRAGASCVSHILNSGAGAATLTGLCFGSAHDYDYVATMDADGQHDPKDVLKGLNYLTKSNVDLAIGSRMVGNSEQMSLLKTVGNALLTNFTWVLFGVRVTDSQSGLRIFNKKAAKDIRWDAAGYEFCSEMLWRAKQKKMIIGEFSIKSIYSDYSKAKGQSNWNGYNIIKKLTAKRLRGLFE